MILLCGGIVVFMGVMLTWGSYQENKKGLLQQAKMDEAIQSPPPLPEVIEIPQKKIELPSYILGIIFCFAIVLFPFGIMCLMAKNCVADALGVLMLLSGVCLLIEYRKIDRLMKIAAKDTQTGFRLDPLGVAGSISMIESSDTLGLFKEKPTVTFSWDQLSKVEVDNLAEKLVRGDDNSRVPHYFYFYLKQPVVVQGWVPTSVKRFKIARDLFGTQADLVAPYIAKHSGLRMSVHKKTFLPRDMD